jgi:riboflavin kinase/FMN adenylyltransferase
VKPKPVVLTLGTFDGVHRGHRALLARARKRADALNGDVLAVAFERPPRLYFRPDLDVPALTTPEEKEEWLRRYGADRVESPRFGPAFARLTAREFLDDCVRRRWKAREVVVGFNFFFGRGREGTPAYLKKEGPRRGLRVHAVPALVERGRAVSSGRIRERLAAGDLAAAHRGLGHPYTLIANVVKGRGLGRRLGYPTANLKVPAEKLLPPGVHAVRVDVPNGVRRGGILNVGTRPTVVRGRRRVAEVHILDYTGRLPGRRLRLEWVAFLRPEKRFASLAALRAQIDRDEARARRLLFP